MTCRSSSLGELVERWRVARNGDGETDTAAMAVWDHMGGSARESMCQLLFAATPVWDGDHISKMGRDELIYAGLAVRVCHLGEQGFTSATYPAYSIFRSVKGDDQLRAGQKQARERFRSLAQKTIAKRAHWLAKMWPDNRKQLSVLLGDQ